MGFDGATVMILVLLLLAVVLVLVFLRYVPLGLWVRALSSGVKVKVSALIGMRLRRISPHRLVDTLIMVRKAGLDITLDQLEKHLLAGGNIERVAKAMISAQQASIPMTFAEACAIDLAGRDVLQAVQMSVIPKVIETPPISAVAKDGIELRDRAHGCEPSGGRRRRGNHYRPRRRGHRNHHRLLRNAQGRAGEPRSHQPDRAEQGPG